MHFYLETEQALELVCALNAGMWQGVRAWGMAAIRVTALSPGDSEPQWTGSWAKADPKPAGQP